MLRAAIRAASSISAASPLLRQQARALCTAVKRVRPDVGEVYGTLLEQSSASTPVACNFISQVVDRWAEAPHRLAIRCIDQDTGEREEITYEKLARRSHQVAAFLAEQGIKKGDSVALMLGQRPAWWYNLAGLMRSGVAAVPCPRLLTPNDLLYRINDLSINGIITAEQKLVDSIRPQCPSLRTLLTTDSPGPGWHSLNEIFNDERIIRSPEVITTTEDPCVYLYTSGTTGQPKAVQHNADYPFFHWPTGRLWLQATPDDLIYNASDTGWGFTVWLTTAAWAMGAAYLVAPTNQKFNPQKMLATLRDEPVTIFGAAPTVLRLLVAQPNFDSFKFRALKRIVTVGEALDETVINRFAAHGVEISVGFGQAETPLLMGRIGDQTHVPNTMGRAIPPYKMVVLNEEYQPLPPGSVGQLAVDLIEGKSGGIMRQYANAPEKTKKSRSPDRRYHLTGDWVKYLPDGLFSYEGRGDDVIKASGYRIGPDEVEKAGMSHPAVAKIAVVGVRTQADSHAITVKAFILLKPGYTETQMLIEEIQQHIKQETAPYKYPRLVEFLEQEEWSKYETTSGKIRRAGLREREKNKLAADPISHEVTRNILR
jgi:acyl-coenzyme A synthetase/AMP-(fatty) acid ligase